MNDFSQYAVQPLLGGAGAHAHDLRYLQKSLS